MAVRLDQIPEGLTRLDQVPGAGPVRLDQVPDAPTFPGGAGGQFGGRGVTGEWEEPAPEPKTWGDVITHGYRRAGTMMVKQLAGLGKYEAEIGGKVREWAWEKTPLGKKPEYLQKIDTRLKEWSGMMLEGVEQYYDENPEEAIQVAPDLGYLRTVKEYVTKPKNLVQGIIESSPLVLEGILGGMIGGPAVGIATMGTPITGEVYADARKEGTEPLPAMAQAILTGTGEAVIEQWTLGKKLGLARNFRKMVAGGLPKVLWEGTKAFFRGTTEEGTQEFNRNFWQWVFTDRSQAWMENVAESAAAGGPMELVMAGGFSGAGATGTMVSNAHKMQRVEKIRAAVNANENISKQHRTEIGKELDAALENIKKGDYDEIKFTSGINSKIVKHIISEDVVEGIEQDPGLTPEEKTEQKLIIGNIRTRIIEDIVERFPQEIADIKSLEKVGNAIAQELGIEKTITWKFSRPSNRLNGTHRNTGPNTADISINSGRLSEDMKKTIVHELGHIAKPPTLGRRRRRRSVHHRAFKQWFEENKEILKQIVKRHEPIPESTFLKVREEAPTPEAKPGVKKYEGEAYRSPTGTTVKGTAADVVRFEQEELGNNLGVTKSQLEKLEDRLASDIVWVTREKVEAARYTQEDIDSEVTADDLAAVEEVDVAGGEIIADIGPDGVLVLKPEAEAVAVVAESLDQAYKDQNLEEVDRIISEDIPALPNTPETAALSRQAEKLMTEMEARKPTPPQVLEQLGWAPAVEPEAPVVSEPITKIEKDVLRDAGFSVSEILDMDPIDARAMLRDPVVKMLDTSEQNPVPTKERTVPKIKDPGIILKYFTSKRVLMQRIGADKFTGGLLAAKEKADVLKGTLNKDVNKVIRALRRRASLGDRIASKIMKRQTKPVRRMVDMLDTYERLPDEIAKNVTPEEIDGFNKLRDITEWLLERTNIARAETGRPLIGNIKAYLPHWYDAMATEVINGTYIHKSGYIGRLMKNVPKTIPNRTALHREIIQKIQDYMEQDLGTLMRGLISYDIHDMLLANPLAATWDELLQLQKDNKISNTAYNEVANYIKYDILQRQAPIDKAFNNAAIVKTPTELINKVLRPLNREISDPAKTYFGGFRKLMHAAFLPFRPRPATRNLGQRLLNLTFYRGRDLLRAQFGKQNIITHPETGEQIKILDYIREQDWYKLSKPEDILSDRTLLARLISVGMIGFKLAHVGNRYASNVEVSALTAYYDWKYRFNESHDIDSKHYKHIVKESKKTDIPIEQLQTQRADMMNDIRDGVQQTQWEYMSHNMPVIFRGQTARGLAAYQSWWMNYFMSHTAEGWHRLITGRTRIRGDGTGGRLLTPYARLRAVKGLGTVYGIGKLAKKTLGIVMLSALFMPDPLTGGSPLLQFVANMAKVFLGNNEEKKQAWRDIKRLAVHLLPFSNAARDIAKLNNDWTLKDYVFYTENEEWRQIWIPVEPEKKKKKKGKYGGGYIL